MSSAWGKAFGNSFGQAWGHLGAVQQQPQPHRGAGYLQGLAFTLPRPRRSGRSRRRRDADLVLLAPR